MKQRPARKLGVGSSDGKVGPKTHSGCVRRWAYGAVCVTSLVLALACVVKRTTTVGPAIDWTGYYDESQICVETDGSGASVEFVRKDRLVWFWLNRRSLSLKLSVATDSPARGYLSTFRRAGIYYYTYIGRPGVVPCVTVKRLSEAPRSRATVHPNYDLTLTAVEQAAYNTVLHSTFIEVPLWLLALLFSVLPVSAVVRGPMRSGYRRARGRCGHCGYDLTGNTSGRCPECGRPVHPLPGWIAAHVAPAARNPARLLQRAAGAAVLACRHIASVLIREKGRLVRMWLRGAVFGAILAMIGLAIQSHDGWRHFVQPDSWALWILLPGTILDVHAIFPTVAAGALFYGLVATGVMAAWLVFRSPRRRCR